MYLTTRKNNIHGYTSYSWKPEYAPSSKTHILTEVTGTFSCYPRRNVEVVCFYFLQTHKVVLKNTYEML